MKKANIITEAEYYERFESIREDIGREIYNKDGAGDLIFYLRSRLYQLTNLQKRVIVNKNTLVKLCISQPLKWVITCAPEVLQRNNINPDIETLTVRELARLPKEELNNFFGIKPVHIRSLKEIVKSTGLQFK